MAAIAEQLQDADFIRRLEIAFPGIADLGPKARKLARETDAHVVSTELAALGVTSFACTPDAFPDLMAVALAHGDVNAWAASRGIVTSRGT